MILHGLAVNAICSLVRLVLGAATKKLGVDKVKRSEKLTLDDVTALQQARCPVHGSVVISSLNSLISSIPWLIGYLF